VTNVLDRLWVRLAPGGQYESVGLRNRFRRVHDIDIGLYSIGAFDRWRLPPGTRVGRYCSIAKTARLVEADHPVSALTTHPYLYLPEFGVVGSNAIPENRQQIEDDVWIGHNAIILPGCKRVGRGAVIGAGAVVMADVPRYAIMSGAPARLVRFRFAPDVIAAIEATGWWTLDRETLRRGLSAVPEFGSAPTVDAADLFLKTLGKPGLDRAAIARSVATNDLPKLGRDEVIALFASEVPDFSETMLGMPIADLPIDSFAFINLRVMLEARTGRQVHDTAWGALQSPSDLVGEGMPQPVPGSGPAPIPYPNAERAEAPSLAGTDVAGLHLVETGNGEPMPAGEIRRYRINMPQMALRGLAEPWLMKELGDIHWSVLMRELETSSASLADAAGDRLYATFTRIRYQSDVPLTDYRENERLAITMTEERYGAAMFFGTARIEGVRGSARAELMTTFSKYGEAGANTSLLKGQPVIPEQCRIPLVAGLPPFAAEYRALRAADLPPVLAEIDYDILPAHDINGVGLLYFAAYPSIVELCIARLKGAAVAFETSLVERDISYFANADPSDRILFRLHDWQEDPAGLFYEASLARASDGKTMARVRARKRRVSLPPPGRPVAVED
jgi:probable biosynthetic protein (TIGR04098 family)